MGVEKSEVLNFPKREAYFGSLLAFIKYVDSRRKDGLMIEAGYPFHLFLRRMRHRFFISLQAL